MLLKIMEAIKLNEGETEIRGYLFDLAAAERGEVSEDIVEYIMKNDELRAAIRMAQQRNEGNDFWKECAERLQ